MAGSTAVPFNSAAPKKVSGLTRDYHNHLLNQVPRAKKETPEVVAPTTTQDEEEDIFAPPQRSSDEESADSISSVELPIKRKAPWEKTVHVPRSRPSPRAVTSVEGHDGIRWHEPNKIKTYSGRGPNKCTSKSNSSSKAMASKKPRGKESSSDVGGKKTAGSNSFKIPPNPSLSKIGQGTRLPKFNPPPEIDLGNLPLKTKAAAPTFKEFPALPPETADDSRPRTSRRKGKVSKPKPVAKKRSTRAAEKALAAIEDQNIPTKAIFRVPPGEFASASASSPLSSPGGGPLSTSHSADLDLLSSATTLAQDHSPPKSPDSVCPACSAPVSPQQLQSFKAQWTTARRPRLSVQQQLVFCGEHRSTSARATWHSRGYPAIDWTALPERFGRQKHHILSIIYDTSPSFYRQREADRRAKVGRQTICQELRDDGDMPELVGYYGGRGGRAAVEWIMWEFSEELRRVKAEPLVVSCGGPSNFCQAVLVPEMIMRLVIEDLRDKGGEGKDEEREARRVMEEGADLGALLCQEEDDVVEEEQSEAEKGYGE